MRRSICLPLLLSLTLTSAGVAAEGPCDAWSDDCRDMEQANACLAEFIRTDSKADILRCVSPDEATATRIFCSCYGCSEPVVQRFAVTNMTCSAANGAK